MAKSKKEPVKVKKNALREQIATTLETTFTDLKESVGEKKFARQVKKASKVLASGAVKKTSKVAAAPKAKAAAKAKTKAPAKAAKKK
ncbi:hypothetical protein GFS24_23060 [Chitinophaga sp. SYP-B3965]|uniref:hypothetical protein n=1 Tax=Chitinophaga sp. SYP-B3965 TaxID=2663120 RepID=UPI0012999F69|nr:hypothetical protein [Chitinophaga sp. SYP-B3965]MRG48019.1 hypothetical protein [Chitinophaga sp. SYP-B3965]